MSAIGSYIGITSAMVQLYGITNKYKLDEAYSNIGTSYKGNNKKAIKARRKKNKNRCK